MIDETICFHDHCEDGKCVKKHDKDCACDVCFYNICKHKWIAVKDQLPPLDQDVLVWCSEKKYGYIGDSSMQVARMYFLTDNAYWTCWQNVVFWMPLPEPPQIDP